MNQMKENEMVGQLAHVGDTRYAYKIEVGNLDVKRKIGRMICNLNLFNIQVLFVGDQSVCYLVYLRCSQQEIFE